MSDIPSIMRAVHQTLDGEPKILADPIVAKLVDVGTLEPDWLTPILGHPFAKQWRAGFLVRSRYAEDCLAAAVVRGISQYLILGAGLDTFAYRQPGWAASIRIFELDHPATQSFKRERLAKSNIALPGNLAFLPIDFETTSLRQALSSTEFRFDHATFCAWLGVTQYLTDAAIDTTLKFLLSLPRGSEIVFSFILPQEELSGVEADAVATAVQKSAEVGEPWLSRFRPPELIARLRRMGFSEVIHFTPEEADARYLKGRHDGLTGRYGEQSMRAVV
ncbi:MAG TPA: SAM-dependent methyltransferase [Stellaceae bacterium]|nr:SAM-dependent methyltransferase [Stellaceae bacterium]